MSSDIASATRRWARLLAVFVAVLGFAAVSPQGTAHAATQFKVLAFYDGTYDAAHIDFDKEANQWFPQMGAQYGFSYTSTTDWNQLNASTLSQYQVVMFLDNMPQTAAQRSAFEQYMRNGGGWMGFHVSAWNDNPSAWSWYFNDFLGTGAFASNTWGPTSVTLRNEAASHPAMAGVPATFTSSVAEWYAWQKDLRQNPNMQILASIDSSSFPVGTDPNQSWYSGYYPIVWSNKAYKMVYANFGHNAMNYSTNTRLSSTFANADQNRLVINSLMWLGGGSGTVTPPSGDKTGQITNQSSSKCIGAAGGTLNNGNAVDLYGCVGSSTQQWTVGSDKTIKIAGTNKCLDLTNGNTADGTPVQLWDCYAGSANQQWTYNATTHDIVSVKANKCLDLTGNTTADLTKVQIWTCTGGSNQKWNAPA